MVKQNATKQDLVEHATKPWKKNEKPKGLFVLNRAISKDTARSVWKYFNADGFPWVQRFKRFPKTAHFNNWRCSVGDDKHAFERDYPALHTMANEAVDAMKRHLDEVEPDSSFKRFKIENINVHLHKPNWGLGAHYDDSQKTGDGMVLMISIGNEGVFDKQTRKPRTFLFTDPVRGCEYAVETPCRQVILFKDECYDLWRHESVRNKNQTGDCLSFTVRLKSTDGNHNHANDREFPRGAPAAEKQAHKRMRAKYGIADRNSMKKKV